MEYSEKVKHRFLFFVLATLFKTFVFAFFIIVLYWRCSLTIIENSPTLDYARWYYLQLSLFVVTIIIDTIGIFANRFFAQHSKILYIELLYIVFYVVVTLSHLGLLVYSLVLLDLKAVLFSAIFASVCFGPTAWNTSQFLKRLSSLTMRISRNKKIDFVLKDSNEKDSKLLETSL